MIIRLTVALAIALGGVSAAGAFTADQVLCPISKSWTEGAEGCPCQPGWKPTEQQLDNIQRAHRQWMAQKKEGQARQEQAGLGQAILCNSDLQKANLRGAALLDANLEGANMSGADLTGADLSGANLQRANLSNAKLEHVNFYATDLRRANLKDADLKFAMLYEANIEDARLAFAKLGRAIYGPVGTPNSYIVGIEGLDSLSIVFVADTLRSEFAAVIRLRELMQRSGYRDEERELTYSIEYWKTKHAIDLWQAKPFNALEGVLRVVLFQWTTAYGLHPFRALQILFGMIIVLALVAYVPALRRGHCIYRIWPSGRVEAAGDETTLATGDKVEMLQPRGLGSTLGYALLFSLISAFQIGWRELNVGNWIARLARFEYVLKPVGWTRTIAGIQSLVSLYLVAIWALTYFGRPFQ